MALCKETGLRELALFAGAGGGILGGLLLGWRTVCAVEIEEYPRAILLQRQLDGILPRFPIWDDVRTFDGRPWRGKVDIITGGFPCQDISAAGNGAGLAGKRSRLWSEMARIIGEVRPQFAIVENSPMLTSRGLDRVLMDMAEMGYYARWGVFGACDTGATHERQRIWILANSSSGRCGSSEKRKMEFTGGTEIFSPDQNDCGWVSDWWNAEPRVDRVVHGVPDGMDRIRALGNSQVPAVVKLAWETLTSEIE